MARFGQLQPENTASDKLSPALRGYDDANSRMVVQLGTTAVLYLLDNPSSTALVVDVKATGDGGSVFALTEVTDDPAKLTKGEKDRAGQDNLRKFEITGQGLGSAQIVTTFGPGGGPYTLPFTVVVVQNPDLRMATGPDEPFANALKAAAANLSLKQTAVLVAEDQAASAVGRQGSNLAKHGGLYGGPKAAGINWCGVFACWCYRMAAKVKDDTSPFGADWNCLASPYRAISFGMARPDKFTVLQFPDGANPMAADNNLYGAKGQRAERCGNVAVDTTGADPDRAISAGDVCLVRGEPVIVKKADGTTDWSKSDPAGYKHVTLVHRAEGERFWTIDGNAFPAVGVNGPKRFDDMYGRARKYMFLRVR